MGRIKSEKKLPTWFKTKGILFPPQLNLEQSSSEITAQYKKSLLKKGTLIDLTGGFGVDVMAFAEDLEQVYHCEINESLSAMVAHNAQIFLKNNIQFIIGESQKYLEKSKKFTHIFIDPSRRINSSKVFLLKDCEPNILDNLEHQNHNSIYSLQFLGTSAQETVIQAVIKKFDISLNILFANMTEINGTVIGQMFIQLLGDQLIIQEAIKFLEGQGVKVEQSGVSQ